MATTGILFVISAPSGAGKTTVARMVLDRIGAQHPITRIVTTTTRPTRPGERDGIDYNFLSKDEFLAKKNKGFFLETNLYDGHWYGSPASIVTDLPQGKSLLIVTDRNGARTLKKIIPSAVLIWIDVPDAATVAQRLGNRETQASATLQRRITIASAEMEEERHEKLFDHHVMNETLEKAVADVASIIKKSYISPR